MTEALMTSSPIEQHVVLHDVSWQTYEALLRELEGQPLKLTFDRGTLEIITLSPRHEKSGKLIARLVETFTLHMNIPLVGLGSTTWRREALAKGIEADECYYVANAAWAAGREEFDLDVDPPPDLAIEVDLSRSSLDKQAIFSALGVPELWRYEDERLSMLRLSGSGEYQAINKSPSLPGLSPAVIEQFVAMRTSRRTDTQILAEFVDWVRSEKSAR